MSIHDEESLAFKVQCCIGDYPDCDRAHLDILFLDERTRKIASCLTNGNLAPIAAGDFLTIAEEDEQALFLHGTGEEFYENTHFDEITRKTLAVALFNLSSLHVDPQDPRRVVTYMNEGIARQSLARLGQDPVANLEMAIGLYERCLADCFVSGTLDFARALQKEGEAREELAGLGQDPIANLKTAIRLYKRSRAEGFVWNPEFESSMLKEAEARLKLADLNDEPDINLGIAFELSKRCFLDDYYHDAPESALARLYQADAILKMHELGLEHYGLRTLKEAVELYERSRAEGLEADSPEYARALQNEETARRMMESTRSA